MSKDTSKLILKIIGIVDIVLGGIVLFSGGALIALQDDAQITEALGSSDFAGLIGIGIALGSVILLIKGISLILVKKDGRGAMWIICLILTIISAVCSLYSVKLLDIALDALSLYCLFKLKK